jgi:hypothetical protein
MKTMVGMILVLIGMGLMLQGCLLLAAGAGAGAGVATVAYVKGELKTTYAASLDRAWDATLSALKDLQINVRSSKKDATEGNIEASKADGTKVKIALEPAGPDTTSVRIRVGTFGDEEASKVINRKIASSLGVKSE